MYKNKAGTNNNNLNNENNNNNFLLENKNELIEFKNDFIQMKSLLSLKRNPEAKIEIQLENMENEKTEENGGEKNNDIQNEKNENEEEENKKEINKKRIKKVIKKNNLKKEEIKQKNQNKEKGEGNNKQINNKNIADYFSLSGKKENNQDTNSDENKNDLNVNNLSQEENNNNNETTQKDAIKEINSIINKNENSFSLEKNNKIKYDNSYMNEIKNVPEKIKDFYFLNYNSINENNKKEYLLKLKNYLIEFNSINNIGQFDETNTQNKKLIYIHNSFVPIKKIPKEKSNLINPRNFLSKDEYLIDYEKDSEDEYMEENAEDIKSNDNEDNEEEEEEDINSQQDDQFIVPDGHLSEEEVSDKDIMEERRLFEKSKGKSIDIMTIVNVRKNFLKPVLIDFSKKRNDDKINILLSKLTIGLFNYNEEENNNACMNINMEIENNNNNNEEGNNININNVNNENKNNCFPIVIGSKVTKYKGIQDSIKIHFEDILRVVHGSYETKEHLILELNKKFEDISKKTLNTFFKEKCLKVQKKFWMINNDTLSKFNLKAEDIEKIKKENFNIYKEKEEKRKKELEEIKIKDGIIQAQNLDKKNDDIKNENKNEKDNNNDKNKSKEKKQRGKSKSRSRNKNFEGMGKIDLIFVNKPIEKNNDNNYNNNNKNSIKEVQTTYNIFNIKKVSDEEKKRELFIELNKANNYYNTLDERNNMDKGEI